jgi:restriction system protein
MKRYFRVMLGKGSNLAAECVVGNFIGVEYDIDQDLTNWLAGEWRDFNKEFIRIYLDKHPGKSRISAGLACGAIWTLGKGMQLGDIIFSPDGQGNYRVGKVTGDYHYAAGENLFHRRAVEWLPTVFEHAATPQSLQRAGSAGTISDITSYAQEIETLIAGELATTVNAIADSEDGDPAVFSLEKHLEDFLVANWENTELGKDYNIFEEDGKKKGQQFNTGSTGQIDILAVSKDNKRLLVIELKRGRASDIVVGQILRYMGYVKEELLDPGQEVEGVIIALEDDKKLRLAIKIVPSITFFRYELNFKLVKG